eukprot:5498026-Pleurochrysis_carterae.AAC.4
MAGSGVDQVGLDRVYVPCTPTVDNQGQSVAGVATPLEPVVPTGEKGVSGRGGSRSLDVPVRSPGRATTATLPDGGSVALEYDRDG